MSTHRKLVLEGPAAAAVERLARSAGVTPAELIQRALQREDETHQAKAGSAGQNPAPGEDQK